MELEETAIDMRALIDEVARTCRPMAGAKGLALHTGLAENVPSYVEGDPTRLRQVLLNLTGNAVKFTENGRIDVKVETVSAESGHVVLRITVQDTGIGVPEEKKELIFNAFSQVDGSTTRRFGGTGLGLSISNRLVHLMGGRIDVESTPGVGSSFRVEFPTRVSIDAESDVVESSVDKRTLSPRRLVILVAEDSRINRVVAERILTKLGHETVLAVNGREALSAHKKRLFDAILMDVQMPDMDGFEATERIRQVEAARPHRTPIIALTAHAMAGDRERCLEAGMDDYVSKPFSSRDLADALERVLSLSGEPIGV